MPMKVEKAWLKEQLRVSLRMFYVVSFMQIPFQDSCLSSDFLIVSSYSP